MTDGLDALNVVSDKILSYQPRPQNRKNGTAVPAARKPRLLDLFCCAGSAGIGHSQVGFEACQAYSDLAKRNGNADEWPRLIEPIRDGSTLAILGSSASSRESEDKYVTGA